MYIRVEHLFNPIYNCFKNSSTYNRHMCVARKKGLQTQNCHPTSSMRVPMWYDSIASCQCLANVIKCVALSLSIGYFTLATFAILPRTYTIMGQICSLVIPPALKPQLLWSHQSRCTHELYSSLIKDTVLRWLEEQLAPLALHQKCLIQAAVNGFGFCFFHNDPVAVLVTYD